MLEVPKKLPTSKYQQGYLGDGMMVDPHCFILLGIF